MDSVQRLLAIAERERRKSSPAPAHAPTKRKPPSAPEDDPARRHQRLQQSLVEAVRAGQEPDREAREELAWFARLAAIAECLPFSRSYISLYHGRPEWPMPEARRLIDFRHPVPAFWSWRPDWHKPQPGMLLQALEDLAVAPSEALMVGDRIEAREAARAAGVPFRWATADWMLW